MQKQQDAGCVRGTGDVLLLYGLNVAFAVLTDPLLLLSMHVFMLCVRQGPVVVCVFVQLSVSLCPPVAFVVVFTCQH